MTWHFKSMKQARDYTSENGAQMEFIDGDYQETDLEPTIDCYDPYMLELTASCYERGEWNHD